MVHAFLYTFCYQMVFNNNVYAVSCYGHSLELTVDEEIL